MNENDLRRALALDDEELTFLHTAALPRQLTALIAAESRAARRAQLLGLLWVTLPAAFAYAGWLVAAPALGQATAYARQAGITNILAAQAISLAWSALDLFASIVEAASAAPGFNAPLILTSVLAALTYLLGVGLPSVRRRSIAV